MFEALRGLRDAVAPESGNLGGNVSNSASAESQKSSEMDAELVKKLAGIVLEKSANIDDRVSNLPGMHRTREQQMAYIEELLHENQVVSDRLQQAYDNASQRRALVRKFVKDFTCEALGIEEGTK
jgi:Subunit 21 of Mediator complex